MTKRAPCISKPLIQIYLLRKYFDELCHYLLLIALQRIPCWSICRWYFVVSLWYLCIFLISGNWAQIYFELTYSVIVRLVLRLGISGWSGIWANYFTFYHPWLISWFLDFATEIFVYILLFFQVPFFHLMSPFLRRFYPFTNVINFKKYLIAFFGNFLWIINVIYSLLYFLPKIFLNSGKLIFTASWLLLF